MRAVLVDIFLQSPGVLVDSNFPVPLESKGKEQMPDLRLLVTSVLVVTCAHAEDFEQNFPDAPPFLGYDLNQANSLGGVEVVPGAVFDFNVVNGVPLRLLPDDPSEDYDLKGLAFSESYACLNDEGIAELKLTDGEFIALSSDCALLGENQPYNTVEWIDCLVTLAHELNHIQYGDWVAKSCMAQARDELGPDASENEVLQKTLECLDEYNTLDNCLRAEDAKTNGDGTGGFNKLEESWVSYKTALCACVTACSLPEGDPRREELLESVNDQFDDAKDTWDEGQEHLAACMSTGYPYFPPLGAPAGGTGAEFNGPTLTSCECPISLDFDPCAETPEPVVS